MPDPASARVLSESRFLDLSPMIDALRFQPADFEYNHGWLRHVPSRHRFFIDRHGGVAIDATCGCAGQPVRQDQARQLFETFTEWRVAYWQPRQVNREFASHFRNPGAWVRLFRDVRMAWRRFRGRGETVALPLAKYRLSCPAASRDRHRARVEQESASAPADAFACDAAAFGKILKQAASKEFLSLASARGA